MNMNYIMNVVMNNIERHLVQATSNVEYWHDKNEKLDISLLPKNIASIKFGCDFNQHVDNLPNRITSIEFGDSFNQYVKHPYECIHGKKMNINLYLYRQHNILILKLWTILKDI